MFYYSECSRISISVLVCSLVRLKELGYIVRIYTVVIETGIYWKASQTPGPKGWSRWKGDNVIRRSVLQCIADTVYWFLCDHVFKGASFHSEHVSQLYWSCVFKYTWRCNKLPILIKRLVSLPSCTFFSCYSCGPISWEKNVACQKEYQTNLALNPGFTIYYLLFF